MKELLRALPKVDDLLRAPELAAACREYGENMVTDAIRREVEILRRGLLAEELDALPHRSEILRRIAQRVSREALPSFRQVINGTGIILHTNLGRACLSEKAALAATDAARRYSNLEYTLETGSRGSRYSHVEKLLCRLTGAESALVVNNNAAAVLLTLAALTAGGQVPVSR